MHVSVARERLPADVAAVFSVPNDRRSVFVVPFQDGPYTYIGTTDTAYEGSLDEPLCTPDDVAYLLGAVNDSTSSDLVRQRRHRRVGGPATVASPRHGPEARGAHRRLLASTPCQ